jgi:hypothetical protein
MQKQAKPHPYYLFAEFVSDLGFTIVEISDILNFVRRNKKYRDINSQLIRLAILYIAFSSQNISKLFSMASQMTKKFNDFGAKLDPPQAISFPEKGRAKRLRDISENLRGVGNLIAHPYRIEIDGNEMPMTLSHGLQLHAASRIDVLTGFYEELHSAHRELVDWFEQRPYFRLEETDWLGEGDWRTDFAG